MNGTPAFTKATAGRSAPDERLITPTEATNLLPRARRPLCSALALIRQRHPWRPDALRIGLNASAAESSPADLPVRTPPEQRSIDLTGQGRPSGKVPLDSFLGRFPRFACLGGLEPYSGASRPAIEG